jgi:ribosome modulation factor
MNPLEYAYEAGYSASLNRRPRSECPLYAMGEAGRQWRERWYQGFDAYEAEYRRRYPLPTASQPKFKATPIRKGRKR